MVRAGCLSLICVKRVEPCHNSKHTKSHLDRRAGQLRDLLTRGKRSKENGLFGYLLTVGVHRPWPRASNGGVDKIWIFKLKITHQGPLKECSLLLREEVSPLLHLRRPRYGKHLENRDEQHGADDHLTLKYLNLFFPGGNPLIH